MIGIVVATHGNLAQAFLDTSKMLIGEQEGVVAVGLQLNDAGSEFILKIESAISQLRENNYDEFVILLDLLGGTPFNQAMKLMERKEIQLLVGANLPMVISALMFDRKEGDIEELVKEAIETAIEGTIDVKKVM